MEAGKTREKVRSNLIEFFRAKSKHSFKPGKTKVQYSGPTYDEKEITAIVDSLLDGWFGVGKSAKEFEDSLTQYLGTKSTVFTNSGSSANLIAISALCSNELKGHLKKGDEVITPAMTFPTTFNPIIQNNLVPLVLDVSRKTFNINLEQVEKAVSKKTRAIVVPHTLGNPNNMGRLMEIVEKHNLFLVEDTADALGAEFHRKKVGSFGHFGTFSFFVAHHITTGEGGAVTTTNVEFEPVLRSIRDWGRACTCSVCKVSLDPNYNCPYRFSHDYADIAEGYDKRYLYLNIGYNLKPLEFQAAMGLVQLKRLPGFLKKRQKNYDTLKKFFEGYSDIFEFPQAVEGAKPAWFSFPLTLKENAPFKRKEIITWLEKHNIESRLIFAGNITRHPPYRNQKMKKPVELKNSDYIFNNSFFVGIYPMIDKEKMDYMVRVFEEFLKEKKPL